jgi:prophage antirepressor-like protein
MLNTLEKFGLKHATIIDGEFYFTSPAVANLIGGDRTIITTMMRRRKDLFGEIKKVENKNLNKSANDMAILISETQLYLLLMVSQKDRANYFRREMANCIKSARIGTNNTKTNIWLKLRLLVAKLIKAEVV